jgi:methylated-DNA-[protein]-cysteine S-methyltransferase
MRLRLEHWNSRLSPFLVVTDDHGLLRALEFADLETRMMRLLGEHYGTYTLQDAPAPAPMIHALDAYFNGEVEAIDEIQTGTGGTAFQREVWSALRNIPAGTTISYGQLAMNLGRAGSARAVGAANGANPIPIVVPCHRVIGANGTLTGFASGLPRKRWLLDHENRFARSSLYAEAEKYAV